MSNLTSAWAWKQELKPTLKFVLVALADHADDEKFICWPSITHLCKKTGYSRSTVVDALNKLEESGFIRRVQIGDISGKTTHYQLQLPSPGNGLPSSTAGLPLVREPDGPSPGAGHGTVIEPSKPMCVKAERIPSSWKPDSTTYTWAKKQGLTPEVVDALLPEFIQFFQDAGMKRKSWDATFKKNPLVQRAIAQHKRGQGNDHKTSCGVSSANRQTADAFTVASMGAFRQ